MQLSVKWISGFFSNIQCVKLFTCQLNSYILPGASTVSSNWSWLINNEKERRCCQRCEDMVAQVLKNWWLYKLSPPTKRGEEKTEVRSKGTGKWLPMAEMRQWTFAESQLVFFQSTRNSWHQPTCTERKSKQEWEAVENTCRWSTLQMKGQVQTSLHPCKQNPSWCNYPCHVSLGPALRGHSDPLRLGLYVLLVSNWGSFACKSATC